MDPFSVIIEVILMFFTQKIKKQLSGADAIKLLQFLL
jgi:hypothetical protein